MYSDSKVPNKKLIDGEKGQKQGKLEDMSEGGIGESKDAVLCQIIVNFIDRADMNFLACVF